MSEIDARGLLCPKPVMLAKRAIDAGEPAFSILVDNKTATENLSNLAKRTGFSVTVAAQDGGVFLVAFDKADASGSAASAGAAGAGSGAGAGGLDNGAGGGAGVAGTANAGGAGEKAVANSPSDSAFFIGKRIIGTGDETLGYNLMKMALFTLSESERVPEVICFMNDGVKLPTSDDEELLGHLRTLNEKGTALLVCGTCLNYYGLADSLKVGTVSNMYDILEFLGSAPKVISF